MSTSYNIMAIRGNMRRLVHFPTESLIVSTIFRSFFNVNITYFLRTVLNDFWKPECFLGKKSQNRSLTNGSDLIWFYHSWLVACYFLRTFFIIRTAFSDAASFAAISVQNSSAFSSMKAQASSSTFTHFKPASSSFFS